MPRVRGKTLRLAKDALRRAHCGVGALRAVRSATAAAGKVISQRAPLPDATQKPKAGTKLPNAGGVTIVVSKGPKPRRG